MEEKQKNTANDSNLNAGEGINIGDRNKVVNKTTNNYYCNEDDPTIRCSYCGFELNDPKNQRTELGIICYSCNQFNYDRPTSRKNTGARFQNIEAGMENKYNFYIDQIEIRLDKKKPNANQEALDYAEKAIELSELTPDAYLYKALCLYFLTTKSNLVDASADKILLLIDTSRSINENYERLRVISGMISGLYFRHINIIIVGLLNNLQSERGKTSIKSYNLQSKIFISKEREIIKFLNQIAVCYEIAPNAFFLALRDFIWVA